MIASADPVALVATSSGASSALRFPCGEAPATGTAVEIVPGVLWMRVPLPTSTMAINVWAVRDHDGWAVFDTGMHSEPAQQAWRAMVAPDGPLGGPPTRVFGTHMHADHIGMAGWLAKEFGCELWMTRAEYQQARILIVDKDRTVPSEVLGFYRRAGWDDAALASYRPLGRFTAPLPESFRRLQDGQRLRIGSHTWQVVVGSGHSPEHACLHCPERGLLISGDQVLPLISSNVSVSHTEPHADPMAEWLASIDKLRTQVPDDVLVLPAHGDPFHGLHFRLDRLADKRHRALDRLRPWIAAQPRRVVDTFEALFRRATFSDFFTLQLATGEAIAYLNYLLARGEARVSIDDEGKAWYHGRG